MSQELTHHNQLLKLLPEGFGWCMVALFASFLVNMWMSMKVMGARKDYGVEYPSLYAVESENKNAKAFNCVQRGHQNFLEVLPSMQLLTVINGLVGCCTLYPAVFMGVFLVGRVIYMQGYSTGGPKGRTVGSMISHLGDLPMVVFTMYNGGHLLGWW